MIDVLIKFANREIKEGTILKIVDESQYKYDFEYKRDNFYKGDYGLEDLYSFDIDFLNAKVELLEKD